MIKKRIISVLLVIILILGISFTSFATDNQTNNNQTNENQANNMLNSIITNDLNQQKNEVQGKLEEANSQLEYVQGEISATLLQIQKLDDKIRQYENENAELKQRLADFEKSIIETSTKLNTVTQDYTKKEELLKNRLVALYEAGDISYLDVLLSAESLTDFLSIYYVMIEMTEFDTKLLEDVEQQKHTIEISKQKLENEQAQVKILKVKAEQNEIIVKNTKTLQEGYIAELSTNEQKLNNEIQTYKEENARIEAKLQEISNGIGDMEIQYTGGKMLWPVAISGTAISSSYGTREHPISGVVKFHQGIDIANTGYGAPTVAALDGIVTYAGWLGSYGNCVMIYHGNNITTVYAHGQKVLTQKGAVVKQGDVILETGSTGNSTGPHLHFEVRVNGITVNPLLYVNVP